MLHSFFIDIWVELNKTQMQKLLFLIFVPFFVNAQASYDIDEGKPVELNGIEYGFEIRNESKKEVKDETFNRFEVTVYATNKSGCSKLMFPRQTLFGLEYQEIVAHFDCVNATGKRLTAKSGAVRGREFTAPYTTTIKNSEGKNVESTVSVKVGHIFRNGDSIINNFIVIVPGGERPEMRVRIIELRD